MAFTKFLLLLFMFPFVSSALVAPPTNVTLTCRNLRNILSWDYENDVPGLRFHILIRSSSDISGCPTEMWVNKSSRQADLSFLSHPNKMYLVAVKAVLGEDESDSSPEQGIEFSYFSSAPYLSVQKCLLDIPPVKITTLQHHHIQVEFKHPWLVYKDGLDRCKTQKKKKNDQENKLPIFKYNVNEVGQNKSQSAECYNAVCKTKLQMDMKQDKHCLKINGELELMTVVSTEESCTHKASPPLNHTSLVVGIIISIIAALALIATMVFCKQTKHALAKLSSKFDITPESKKPPFNPLPVDHSPVAVCALPMTPDDPIMDTVIIPKSDEDYDPRIKLSPNDNQALTEESEEESTSDDPYMSGQKLESDPEEPDVDEPGRSPYECRAVVLELAPEDRAEGYRA